MKNLTKAVVFAAALSLTSTSAFAQATGEAETSDTASTTAIIVAPLEINVERNLHFGEIIQPKTAGTATVGTDDATAATGGVVWYSEALVSAAEFSVEGLPGETVYITLPGSTYDVTGPGDPMEVSDFVSDPVGTIVLDGTEGTGTILVGATLAVDAAQEPGEYSNADDLVVTVSY